MRVNLPCPAHIEPEDWRRACEITERAYVKVVRALPWWIDREGVWSEALLMLWRKGNEFDPKRRVRFSTFCAQAVHGAMIEAIRRESPFSRRQHERQKADDDYAAPWVSLDAPVAEDEPDTIATAYPDPGPGPEAVTLDQVEQEQLGVLLSRVLQQVPARQRQILLLHYHEERTYREIGGAFRLSAARAEQLRDQGIAAARATLQEVPVSVVVAAGLAPAAVPDPKFAPERQERTPDGYVNLRTLARLLGLKADAAFYQVRTGKFPGACLLQLPGQRQWRWYVPCTEVAVRQAAEDSDAR